MPAYRTFLFAPGNHPRKVEKVFGCGSDNVILDLEDAVANAEKVATRATALGQISRKVYKSFCKRRYLVGI